MQNKKGPFALFLLIATLATLAYFGKIYLFDKRQADTSDSLNDTKVLKWAGDSYLGYAFLHTVEMKKQLARKGISLEYEDDGGNYKERLEKFAEGSYDFIVLPVNSYIEHGMEHKFPGVIVSTICESKGADAIVGFADVLPNNRINDLDNSDLVIYYTSKSPSSFLLDLTISDFDLGNLRLDNYGEESLMVPKKCIKKLRRHQGTEVLEMPL